MNHCWFARVHNKLVSCNQWAVSPSVAPTVLWSLCVRVCGCACICMCVLTSHPYRCILLLRLLVCYYPVHQGSYLQGMSMSINQYKQQLKALELLKFWWRLLVTLGTEGEGEQGEGRVGGGKKGGEDEREGKGRGRRSGRKRGSKATGRRLKSTKFPTM